MNSGGSGFLKEDSLSPLFVLSVYEKIKIAEKYIKSFIIIYYSLIIEK